MPLSRETAQRVMTLVINFGNDLREILPRAEKELTPEGFQAFKRAVGIIIGKLDDSFTASIAGTYPDMPEVQPVLGRLPTDVDLKAILDKYRTHPDFLGIERSDPNQRGAVDDTVMHIAARKGALEDFKIFVANGGDVNAIGDLGLFVAPCGGYEGPAQSGESAPSFRRSCDLPK